MRAVRTVRVLMTGATGSIGRPLVAEMLRAGYAVTVVTRDRDRAFSFFGGDVGIVTADIGAAKTLDGALPREAYDAVVHLAASLDYFGRTRDLYETNVRGTENTINAAARRGIPKMIFVSSIEAVGLVAPKDVPADETYPPRPVSPYGSSKLAAERLSARLCGKSGMGLTVLRIGNVYGPLRPSFIVPLARCIVERDVLYKYLWCCGERFLHPVHIKDAIGGIISAVLRPEAVGTYTICGPEYVTVMEAARTAAEFTGSVLPDRCDAGLYKRALLYIRGKIRRARGRADILSYISVSDGDRVHRAYSIKKAGEKLGFFPSVSFGEGLRETLEWASGQGTLRRPS